MAYASSRSPLLPNQDASSHRNQLQYPLQPACHRNFWTGRKIPAELTHTFLQEVSLPNVDPDLVDITLDSLRYDFQLWQDKCRHDKDFFLGQEDQGGNRDIISKWDIVVEKASELHILPSRIPHSGSYEWIGKKSTEPPKWLWDSEAKKTVRATKKILKEGYIAVSYTWGRWCKKGQWRTIPGAPWGVPVVEPGHGDVEDMIPILSDIPAARYFWVDALCINQQDINEKRQEISKQGSIFENAKAVLVWAWSIPRGHDLALAIYHLGTSLIWSLRVNDVSFTQYAAGAVTYKPWNGGNRRHRDSLEAAKILWDDPWFNSLWTIQELVLCPSGLLMAKTGEYCRVNQRPTTISLIAATIELVRIVIQVRRAMKISFWWTTNTWIQLFGKVGAWWKYADDPFYKRWLLARSAIRKHRYVREQIVSGGAEMWLRWERNRSLSICLDADRTAILAAVTMRSSRSRRGEAVLAALKVATYDGVFDKHGVTTSGLPPSLVNKILQAEGARLLMNISIAGKSFFTNVLPSDNQISVEQFLTILRDRTMTFNDVSQWSVRDDGTLHIPKGSLIQLPEQSCTLPEDAWIEIQLATDVIFLEDIAMAPDTIAAKYQKWSKPSMLDKATRSAAIGLTDAWESAMKAALRHISGVSLYEDKFKSAISGVLDDTSEPDAIQVRLVPLVIFEPEDIKKPSENIKKFSKGHRANIFQKIGIRTGIYDIVWGIVLASTSENVDEKRRKWYKCGTYCSQRKAILSSVEEESGMVVGQVA